MTEFKSISYYSSRGVSPAPWSSSAGGLIGRGDRSALHGGSTRIFQVTGRDTAVVSGDDGSGGDATDPVVLWGGKQWVASLLVARQNLRVKEKLYGQFSKARKRLMK